MAAPKKTVHVIFDTSAFHTKVSHQLMSKKARELISEHQKHDDLTIHWYIPVTAVEERRYQMNDVGRQLLPKIARMEDLIGHQLNLTEQVVEDNVNRCIQKELEEFGIKQILIDESEFSVTTLVDRATPKPNCVGVTRRVTQTTDSVVIAYLQLLGRLAPSAGLEPVIAAD